MHRSRELELNMMGVNYWDADSKTMKPMPFKIKTIRIECGECGRDYYLKEEYTDLMRVETGWFGKCPHCKAMNLITFKFVRMITESERIRKSRFKGMFKKIMEDASRRFGLASSYQEKIK